MKKTMMTFSSALILSAGLFLHPSAHAEASLSKTEITQVQNTLSNLTIQLTNLEQSILENESILLQTNKELTQKKREFLNIQKKIKTMQQKAEAKKASQTGSILTMEFDGEIFTYVDVILSASTVEDLRERTLAVISALDDKEEALAKEVNEIQDIMEKQITTEEEITYLNSKKQEFEQNISDAKTQKETVTKQMNDEKAKAAAQEKVEKVLNAGNRYIGKSTYVFGGGRTASDVKKGRFDCSGFVIWAFKEAGVKLSGNTDTIKKAGKQVKQKDMQPGDIVFFDTYKKDGHVGIYVGEGKFIGSQSSTGIAIASLTNGYWKGAFKGKVVRVL